MDTPSDPSHIKYPPKFYTQYTIVAETHDKMDWTSIYEDCLLY